MFKMKYKIEQRLIPRGTKRRSGIKHHGVRFLVAHDTGNDGSSANNNVNYYIRTANDMEASAHAFIDDQHIIECIPLDEKAWHVRYNVTADNQLYGVDANDCAIGIELCYSSRGNINNIEAYKRYVWYIAYLCDKYDLDPNRQISGHDELDPSRKVDPYKNALRLMKITKNTFISDVISELEDCREKVPVLAVYQGNKHLKDFVTFNDAVNYASQWSNANVRKISDGSWVWTNIEPKEKEDDLMVLNEWQKSLIMDGINKLSDISGCDGEKLINSPEVWIEKVKNGMLTAGDLAMLNFAILTRKVEK